MVVTIKLVVTDLDSGAAAVYRRRCSGRDVGVPRLGDLVSTGVLLLPGMREPQAGLYALVEQVLWSDDLDAATITATATSPGWDALAPGLDRSWRRSDR